MTLILTMSGGSYVYAGDFEVAAAIGSDYVVRGETRSRGEPVVQARVGWSDTLGWALDAFYSGVDFHPGPGPSREFGVSLAKTWRPHPDWSLRTGVTHYAVGPSRPEISYDYTELGAAASFRDQIELAVAYMPDYSDFSLRGIVRDRPALAYDMLTRLPVTSRLDVELGAGYLDLDRLFGHGYWYWSAGAGLTFDRLSLAVQYIGTDDTATTLLGEAAAGDRLVASVALRIR